MDNYIIVILYCLIHFPALQFYNDYSTMPLSYALFSILSILSALFCLFWYFMVKWKNIAKIDQPEGVPLHFKTIETPGLWG